MTNFVLIHGSFQGGWIWQRVASRLRAAGHNVFAPTMMGCAERRHELRPGIDTTTFANEVADLLFFEDLKDTVLVGTSSGGMVVCAAAERMRHRVARIVLVDALALFNGERTRDIVKRPPNTGPVPMASGPTRDEAANGLFADLDPATKAWALDRYTPHPTGTSEVQVKLGDFWDMDWDATVIWCRQAPNPGEAHVRRSAARLKAKWHELDTGHYPMLTMPDELTKLILA
ncbi:MAG: alpha/beta fold hydrolase [Rhodospirillales bacterium]